MVKGGVALRAKEAPMKGKLDGWKPTRFYLHCSEERIVLCVDRVDGEWGRCRICYTTRGATSLRADLPCPPLLEWRAVAPMLQHDA